ncbi:MAG: hypothetical protein QGH83_05370 [Candidatus Pacebacteria bacterium]|nr:hypothetical protein [Candidatus Paceibacterota bacterium]
MVSIANVNYSDNFDTWLTRSNQAFHELRILTGIEPLHVANSIVATGVTGYTVSANALNVTVSSLFAGHSNFGNTTLITFPAIANLNIPGGANGQVLTTDGSGTISWAATVGSTFGTLTGVIANTQFPGTLGVSSNTTFSGNNTTFSGNVVHSGANATFGGSHVNLGAVGDVSISGGTTGYPLKTDGSGTLSWGTLGNTAIAAGAVGNTEIATSAITNTHIKAAAVGNTEIATAAVTNTHIKAAAVGNTEIATAAVTNTHIKDAAVGPAEIAAALNLSGHTVTLASTFGKTDATQNWTKGQRGEITALADAATITPDFDDSNNFSVTLGGNRAMMNPTNQTAGQTGSIFVTQDATGSRTLAYGGDWQWAANTAPTLTTTPAAVDRIDYMVRAANSIHAVGTLAYSL